MHSENQSYLGLVLQFVILDLPWLLFETPVGKFNKYISKIAIALESDMDIFRLRGCVSRAKGCNATSST